MYCTFPKLAKSIHSGTTKLSSQQRTLHIRNNNHISLLHPHSNTEKMISPKHLVQIARKWQRVAAMRKKRISLPQIDGDEEVLAHRGHFIVYSIDGKQFMFPISYLNNYVIQELLKSSEDEFGLPSSGPITLPCDTIFMDYLVSMIQRSANAEIEKALLMSITANTCSLSHSLQQNHTRQQLLVCSH
ncbi:hypothetical protein BT93_I1141 [Corymbia citriodora subsp. variegata]|nr:hypothetical protein BT93_I1141 [Corymbia citriodora subsp. variegata]